MKATPGRLWIVRHGPGRGRPVASLDPLVRELRRTAPALGAAIRTHETGGDALPQLDGARAVLFWLGDPLRELYPDCHAEATAIAEAARARGLRLVNPPEALSNTVKSVQARIWRDAGLPAARHVAYADRTGFEAALDAIEPPLLVRPDRLHAQQQMYLCRSRDEARRLADRGIAYPGALAEFIDARAGHRAAQPGSVWARFHHKKRALVLGDVVSPRTCLFSEDPIVGLHRSTYRPYLGRLAGVRRLRLPFDPWARRCVRAENEWWRGGVEHAALLRRAAETLGLGLAAIDYATTRDGRPVLWEANPYFWLPPPRGIVLGRERGFGERFERTCRDFRTFVAALVA